MLQAHIANDEDIGDNEDHKDYNVFFDYIHSFVMTILVGLEIGYVATTFSNGLSTDSIPYSILDFAKVSWLITCLLGQFVLKERKSNACFLLLFEYVMIILSNCDLLIYLHHKVWHVQMSYWFRNMSLIILSFPFNLLESMNKRLPATLLQTIFKALSGSAAISMFVLIINGSSSSSSSSTAIYFVSTFSIIIFVLQTAMLAIVNRRLSIVLFIFHLGLLICEIVNFVLLEADFNQYDESIGQLIVYLMQTALIFIVVTILYHGKSTNNSLFEPLCRLLTPKSNE